MEMVLPVEENTYREKCNENIDGIVNALTGVVNDTGLTLDEYREERLNKYEGQ